MSAFHLSFTTSALDSIKLSPPSCSVEQISPTDVHALFISRSFTRSETEEKSVLNNVYSFFRATWELIQGKKHSDPDPITIGTGISRLDIPGLFTRSLVKNIDEPRRLYDTFLKTKIVDLSEVAIPYLNKNRPKMLYPATTNAIAARFDLGTERKDTGKSVWDMVDTNDFIAIRNRVLGETEVLWKIYNAMVGKIFER